MALFESYIYIHREKQFESLNIHIVKNERTTTRDEWSHYIPDANSGAARSCRRRGNQIAAFRLSNSIRHGCRYCGDATVQQRSPAQCGDRRGSMNQMHRLGRHG